MLDADGSLIIPTKVEPGRLVAGAALVVIGGAIGWQLVRVILMNKASTHAEWSAYIPAVVIFGGLALVFLIPGALMLGYRRSVRIDHGKGEVEESQRYLGYRRTHSYPLSAFRAIVLARRSISRSRRGSSAGRSRRTKSYPVFVVELTSATGRPLRVVTDAQEAPIRDVAVRLRTITGLTLEDRVERDAAGNDEDDE
jgi:hypothetical protein